jgi:DNA replication protein DnaC
MENIMHNNQSISSLKKLKLYGMAQAFQLQLNQPNTYNELCFNERFGLLIDQEVNYRSNNKFNRLVKAAKFKIPATLNDLDYEHPRGLTRDIMASYLSFDWLSSNQNILITGPTGCGKTYLACAIGNTACSNGFSVQYYRASRLFEALIIAHGDGSFNKFITKLAKIDLLIIDDWGLEQLSSTSRNDLLEIMEDRHNIRSTIITSQLPTDTWHEVISDPTLADAIMDRLLHNAHKIKLKGESMRKIKNGLTQVDQVE